MVLVLYTNFSNVQEGKEACNRTPKASKLRREKWGIVSSKAANITTYHFTRSRQKVPLLQEVRMRK